MEIVLGVILIPILLLAWVGVQNAWRRQFGRRADADVLAGRSDCGRCGCSTPCDEDDNPEMRRT